MPEGGHFPSEPPAQVNGVEQIALHEMPNPLSAEELARTDDFG